MFGDGVRGLLSNPLTHQAQTLLYVSAHHDNRDLELLPNYQPVGVASIEHITSVGGVPVSVSRETSAKSFSVTNDLRNNGSIRCSRCGS